MGSPLILSSKLVLLMAQKNPIIDSWLSSVTTLFDTTANSPLIESYTTKSVTLFVSLLNPTFVIKVTLPTGIYHF